NIKAPGSGSGYTDVRITYANLHDTAKGGIMTSAASKYGHKNVYIGHVNAYNHFGTGSTSEVTGSGIFVADCDGVIVERSVTHDNGSSGAAPVGMWASGCNRATFQYNESYNNHTKTSTDGGGFDFDWN